MADAIKRLFEKTGNLSIVKNAVAKRWITAETYKEITGEDYGEASV